jgi:hypothetical protein
MDVTVECGAAGIKLDVDRHKALFAAIGCDTVEKIAAETGVADRTIYRAREGVIGEVFMAQTIAALHRHADKLQAQGLEPPTLDELFTVITRPAA